MRAGSAFFVAVHPGNQAVDAIGTLVFAVLAVAAGIVEALHLSSVDTDASTRHPVVPEAV